MIYKVRFTKACCAEPTCNTHVINGFMHVVADSLRHAREVAATKLPFIGMIETIRMQESVEVTSDQITWER